MRKKKLLSHRLRMRKIDIKMKYPLPITLEEILTLLSLFKASAITRSNSKLNHLKAFAILKLRLTSTRSTGQSCKEMISSASGKEVI